MKNEYECFDGTLFIRTNNGMTMLADTEDLSMLDALPGTITVHHDYKRPERSYACMKIGSRQIVLIHRYLLNFPSVLMVDHINGDGMDNRRKNLRAVPRWRNASNRTRACGETGVLNVGWDRGRQKWRVCVRKKHIGYFRTQDEAMRAAEAAKKTIGEPYLHSVSHALPLLDPLG